MSQAAEQAAAERRHRNLSLGWRVVVGTAGLASVALSLNKILNLGFLVGVTLLDNAYLYLLCALLVGLVFLFLPATARASRDAVPWYDAALYLLSVCVFGYFAFYADRILREAWEFMAPKPAVLVAGVGWLLLLEATRRAGGTAVFVVVSLVSLYPVFAGVMPGPIAGLPQPIETTAAYRECLAVPHRGCRQLDGISDG